MFSGPTAMDGHNDNTFITSTKVRGLPRIDPGHMTHTALPQNRANTFSKITTPG